ncbi:MAG: dihydropteroate synthase [bacterium]
MSARELLRAIALPLPIDAAREAARNRVPPGSLLELASNSSRQLFALSGLTPAIALAIAASTRRPAVLHSPVEAPEKPSADSRPVTCYFGGSIDDVLSLLDEYPNLRETAAPFMRRAASGPPVPRILACRRKSLALSSRPLIMGILNVTPDSFSDGGEHVTPESAIRRAWRLAETGADVIDIGGESTRPGSAPVPVETELDRVLPVIRGLGADFPRPISIDTTKAVVAERALDAGADIINDISGLRSDPRIAKVAADAAAPIVISHIRGTPKTMQSNPHYHDVMAEVAAELIESAMFAVSTGAKRDSIWIDPGIGFGKSFEDNLEILRRLREISSLGLPVLVGASRKSFLGTILGRGVTERLEGSLAAAEAARLGGASMIRVHDVAETRRFLDTLDAIFGANPDPKTGD